MADPTPATLTVAIGESVLALAARSPALIHPEKMDDNSAAVIAQPVQLAVEVNGQPLQLPPTRYAMIEQVAGVVTGVDTAPMLGFADLETCDALAKRLIAHAEANGWTIGESFPSDLGQIRSQLAQPDRRRYERTYAVLRRGGVTLRIYLKEATGSGLEEMEPPARGRLFLVNSDFADEALADKQNERLFARRRELTGGTQSVPLAVWLGSGRQ